MTERAQRRLAAIVSADVAGYSRLMGRDERGTLAALKAHRAELVDDAIARHGGRIVKTTGDGLLLEFPSVVAAVECCVEVQDGMAARNAALAEDQAIRFRVGVHLGDVIVDGDDIFGDGVNIAARLQEIGAPGGVTVSAIVHDYLDGGTADGFADLGERELKNIRRPVRVWQRGVEPPASLPGAKGDAGTPSIAVLPFANMSGDSEQDYFADGIAEDIITELSRFRSLVVIARNSSFTYKGRNIDVKQVAAELGVRYVLEGSVRKGGNRVRITGQLIDAATGNHIWAERYDRELDDIFALQDEITTAIVGAVGAELDSAERSRAARKPTDSLTAWDLYQRGMWHLWRFTDEDAAKSMELCSSALELDASFAIAHSGFALACSMRLITGRAEDRDGTLRRGLAAANTAISIDEKDTLGHLALSRLEAQRGNYETAIAEGRRALELNPNLAFGWYALCATLAWSDQHDEAVSCADRAMRLSPNDPIFWAFLLFKGFAIWHLEGPEAALPLIQKAGRYPNCDMWPDMIATALYIELGRTDEARQAVARILEKRPNMRMSQMAEILGGAQFARKSQLLASLREAGLPD